MKVTYESSLQLALTPGRKPANKVTARIRVEDALSTEVRRPARYAVGNPGDKTSQKATLEPD